MSLIGDAIAAAPTLILNLHPYFDSIISKSQQHKSDGITARITQLQLTHQPQGWQKDIAHPEAAAATDGLRHDHVVEGQPGEYLFKSYHYFHCSYARCFGKVGRREEELACSGGGLFCGSLFFFMACSCNDRLILHRIGRITHNPNIDTTNQQAGKSTKPLPETNKAGS